MAMAVNAGASGIGALWGYHDAEELLEAGALAVVAGVLPVRIGRKVSNFDILFFRGRTGEHIWIEKAMAAWIEGLEGTRAEAECEAETDAMMLIIVSINNKSLYWVSHVATVPCRFDRTSGCIH